MRVALLAAEGVLPGECVLQHVHLEEPGHRRISKAARREPEQGGRIDTECFGSLSLSGDDLRRIVDRATGYQRHRLPIL